jgi:hypothetical protein
MTESNPDDVYKAALTLARHDYAELKARREALLREIETHEKRILVYRRVIEGLAAILGVDSELLPTEEQVRRFRMKT